MLDINLFREEKGNNPEIIRESQRRRFEEVKIVDEIIQHDKDLRRCKFELEQFLNDLNNLSTEVAKLKISGADASSIIKKAKEKKVLIGKKEEEVRKARNKLYEKTEKVGNLVDDSVPVSNDEANNAIVRTWGEKRKEPNLLNHAELVEKLEIADLKRGANVAGGRGYYLKGVGVRLNQALITFALDFLEKRNYTVMQTPLLMQKDIMRKCAQLAEFDEQLFMVKDNRINRAKPLVGAEPEKAYKTEDEKYLIATAEQPLCAYHIDEWIHPSQLPIRYAGYSACFRTEAGSHGKDTLGIFRVHQFEKIEQFCITSPIANGDENSWKMHEEMIKNSEDFYQMLQLPYQIVAIVSGALNKAAAKKYDLEAWFPASSTYRELVSCSNCTDYQSRKLEIRYGQKVSDETKQYCHLLNSTLTATERTMCCILENYQTKDGVEVPEVLQPYMGGKTFLSFPS